MSEQSSTDDALDSIWAGTQIFTFFNEEIQPISITAQSRVKLPDGFDLDTWIVPLRSKPELQSLSADIPLQILEVNESGISELEKIEILEREQAPELKSIIRKPANRKYELKQDFEDGLKDSNTAPPPSKNPDLSSSNKGKTRPDSRKKAHKRTPSQLKEKILTHMSGKKYRVWSHDGLHLQISWSEQAQSLIQQTKIRLETYLSLLDEKGSPIIFRIEPTETSSSIQVHEFDEKHKILIFRLKRENTDALFSKSVSAALSLPESKMTIQFHLPFDINFLLPNQPELATMTPPKFMKILQTPPLGYFSAVGTSNIVAPEAMDLDQICNSLASAINCIIVERHPEASSLYGLLCNNIPIVGLVKKRLNSKGKKVLSIEIKTGDSKVLEWVIDTLSNFAAELVP